MNIEQKARELLTKERLEDENLDENILSRSAEEIEDGTKAVTEEKARELLAKERLEDENLDENMLTRAVEDIT